MSEKLKVKSAGRVSRTLHSLVRFLSGLKEVSVYNAFHPDSPGIRITVARTGFGRLFKSKHFATLREAINSSNSMYAANAKGACVYAFTEKEYGGIDRGEFLYPSELTVHLIDSKWDGFVDLQTDEVYVLKPDDRFKWDDRLIRLY